MADKPLCNQSDQTVWSVLFYDTEDAGMCQVHGVYSSHEKAVLAIENYAAEQGAFCKQPYASNPDYYLLDGLFVMVICEHVLDTHTVER